MSHDQNYKNLILDYPREAIAFFAAAEALAVDAGARILPVARLNLPNMAYAPEDRLAVYAHAVRGLIELEPHPEKRLKYADFIDIYAELDENERQIYTQRYPREAAEMSGFAERFIQQGNEQGLRQGEARELAAQLQLRFGALPPAARERMASADAETLLRWSERVLTAQTLDEVLADD